MIGHQVYTEWTTADLASILNVQMPLSYILPHSLYYLQLSVGLDKFRQDPGLRIWDVNKPIPALLSSSEKMSSSQEFYDKSKLGKPLHEIGIRFVFYIARQNKNMICM